MYITVVSSQLPQLFLKIVLVNYTISLSVTNNFNWTDRRFCPVQIFNIGFNSISIEIRPISSRGIVKTYKSFDRVLRASYETLSYEQNYQLKYVFIVVFRFSRGSLIQYTLFVRTDWTLSTSSGEPARNSVCSCTHKGANRNPISALGKSVFSRPFPPY